MCRSMGVTGFYSQTLQEIGNYLFVSVEFEPTEYSKNKYGNKHCQYALHCSVTKKIAHLPLCIPAISMQNKFFVSDSLHQQGSSSISRLLNTITGSGSQPMLW